MDVNCPKRQYGDLKKVSLAYQEGSSSLTNVYNSVFFGRERWSGIP